MPDFTRTSGRIFPPLQTVTTHFEGGKTPMTAYFFKVWLSTGPTNLEAEIIATHPPAEFLIEPSAAR